MLCKKYKFLCFGLKCSKTGHTCTISNTQLPNHWHLSIYLFDEMYQQKYIVCKIKELLYRWIHHIETWCDVNGVNTLRPIQNGCHLTENIFIYIFLNENVWILNLISLKFAAKGEMNNIPALVQIMAWHCPGDKPLYELMMVSILTHIYITRP